jgi:chemotaxis signal transduction protein
MTDSFSSAHQPLTDDDLRRMIAATNAVTAQPATSQDEFIQLVEQRQDSIVLPSPTAIGCVFFSSGGQRWGVRLGDLDHIITATDPAPAAVVLPDAPPWLLGAFQVDLEIASLVDLSRFLNDAIAERRQRDIALLIIRHAADEIYGLKVSRLSFTSLIEGHDLTYVDALHAPVDKPYLLATYTPQGEPDAEAARALGFLDVRRIAATISAQLSEEGSS